MEADKQTNNSQREERLVFWEAPGTSAAPREAPWTGEEGAEMGGWLAPPWESDQGQTRTEDPTKAGASSGSPPQFAPNSWSQWLI